MSPIVAQNGAMSTDLISPERAPNAKRRRGPSFWIGLGLVLAGIVVLLWFAWQFWGTNWQSWKNQKHNAQLFERGSTLTNAQALVKIPRFGKNYLVPVYPGVSEAVLAKGFGHYRHTAGPGQIGNYALAGHRVTHGQPLRQMPELRPGNKVDVFTHTREYVYVLDTNPNQLIVPMTALWVIDKFPKNPHFGPEPLQGHHQRLLTLTTCSELFHTDNRMIAFGHLVKVKKLKPGELRKLPL